MESNLQAIKWKSLLCRDGAMRLGNELAPIVDKRSGWSNLQLMKVFREKKGLSAADLEQNLFLRTRLQQCNVVSNFDSWRLAEQFTAYVQCNFYSVKEKSDSSQFHSSRHSSRKSRKEES